MSLPILHDGRCKETVYKRDTYRYSGRGKSGFEMHYNKQQCSRKPKIEGYCTQHAKWHGLITMTSPARTRWY